jgi:lysophospholipase L1-like esterase
MNPNLPTATDESRWILRYTRVDQWPLPARYSVRPTTIDAVLGDIVGVTPATAHEMAEEFARARDLMAARLLDDAAARAGIESLAARDGLRVVALGDSITVDRLSWFDVLAAAIEQLHGTTGPLMRNLALSGATSADLLERFDLVHAARPTHLLVMAGTNDARRHGIRVPTRMVTLGETRRNLAALQELGSTELGCWTRLVTPTAVDELRVAAAFSGQPVGWRGQDIDDVAAVVRELDPEAIDLHGGLPVHVRAELLEADGIHPSAAGQLEIARMVLSHLAEAAAGTKVDEHSVGRPGLTPGDWPASRDGG